MFGCRMNTSKYLLASFTFEGGFDKDTFSVIFLQDTIIKDEIIAFISITNTYKPDATLHQLN